MKIGEIVKEYRKSNGLTMQDFADRIGKSKGYISMLERGKNPQTGKPIAPTLETLQSIANVMNVDFNDLIDKLDQDQDIKINPTPTSTIKQTTEIMEQLNEPRRVIVLETARTQLDEQERAQREVTDNVLSLDDYRERTTRTVDGVVSAGGGISQDDNLGLEVSFYSDSVPAPSTYDTIALVAGHSMEPTIKNGDYLFIKATNQVNYSQIGVFQVDGENYVKKLKNGYLESLNPDYPDIPLDENNTIRTIGQVVTVYSER